MAFQRFITGTWTNLGKKSKEQQEPSLRDDMGPSSPEDVPEKGNVADPVQFCDTLDRLSADVGRPHSSPLSDAEDRSSCQGSLHETPASKPSIPFVDSDHDSTSLEANADPPKRPSDALRVRRPDGPPQLRRSKSILGTLKKKLRIRIPVPGQLEHIGEKPVTRTQSSGRETTHRPQAVPITLSNDFTSRERREEALRARGLLPPRGKPNLSAIEADEDRRIDALGTSSTSLPDPERTRSEANDIAKLWRQSNLRWLSEADLDITADPMTKVASQIDISNHPEGPSEIPTAGADPIPFASSPSSLKSLSLDTLPSPTMSIMALSDRDPQDSPPLQGAALESINQEGPTLPSSSLENLPFSVPTEELSEDANTHSTQLAVSSPAPSKLSCLPEIVEDPQEETTALQTQKSASPSQLEDLKLLDSLHLLPDVSDTCLASPTTQTLSTSRCYSPLDTPDSPATGEFFPVHLPYIVPATDPRADVTPLGVKNGEGEFLCPSIIFEGPESFPDDEVVDPFAHPSNSPLSTPIPALTGHGPTPALPQCASNAALGRPKNRSSTLSVLPSAAIPKSASMVNLRRVMSSRTNSLFKRPQPRSTVVQLDPTPLSPPPAPLKVMMYSDATISMEASRIDDDEVRRLSEVAFAI